MNTVAPSYLAEMLDEIEMALDADEVLREQFQTQMVAENVTVLLDSCLPNGRQLRTAR